MHDLIMIGGGPAGIAAGIYAARKKIKTLLITESFGGQSSVSNDIQNWVGTKSISGLELAKNLEDHLRAQQEIEIIENKVERAEKSCNGFKIVTKDNTTFETKTLLITSGARRRKLKIPGEEEFAGKGVFYCSTCDAPLFKNKTVAVIGSGNSGLEGVLDLLTYTKKIYLLEFLDHTTGDSILEDKIKKSDKVEIIFKARTLEILGREFVTGLKYEDLNNNQIKELKLEGIFVEIGSIPNSDLVKSLVKLNKQGEIIVNCRTQKTSQEGIWAAGDVSDCLYKQNNIAAGDSIKAVLNIAEYLNKRN